MPRKTRNVADTAATQERCVASPQRATAAPIQQVIGPELLMKLEALRMVLPIRFGLDPIPLLRSAIAGIMYSAVIIAQGITPYLMDVDFDHHRSYRLSLHVIQALVVLGAAIIACLPVYAKTKALWVVAAA